MEQKKKEFAVGGCRRKKKLVGDDTKRRDLAEHVRRDPTCMLSDSKTENRKQLGGPGVKPALLTTRGQRQAFFSPFSR
jgi:hypothetical protein